MPEPKKVTIISSKEDIRFLKSRGINRSRLFRQVTNMIKKEKFIYQYVDEED